MKIILALGVTLFCYLTNYSQTFTYTTAEFNSTSKLQDSEKNYLDSLLYKKKGSSTVKLYKGYKSGIEFLMVKIVFNGETETYIVGNAKISETDSYGRQVEKFKTLSDFETENKGIYSLWFLFDSKNKFERIEIDINSNQAKLVVKDWTEAGKIRNVVITK